ncbi:hypothetical protein SLEP1_g12618 [Rubroshorea leprosula]|uniref:Uncharacterized protein n=1 Tax=Rubroshorea leprosula TaxID=152421 RepID=A0AAV5IMA0_9ROSI|nr:hypothetical protein SLEP1_g12618 [Rubroshorea leprosula]
MRRGKEPAPRFHRIQALGSKEPRCWVPFGTKAKKFCYFTAVLPMNLLLFYLENPCCSILKQYLISAPIIHFCCLGSNLFSF